MEKLEKLILIVEFNCVENYVQMISIRWMKFVDEKLSHLDIEICHWDIEICWWKIMPFEHWNSLMKNQVI